MNKHFITGGAGFIGSHLIDRLLKEGNQVVVYDNLVTGKKENIIHHFGEDGFSFIQADLLDLDKLKMAMKGNDIIWHLGANTDIPLGNQNTDIDLKNCTIATYNILEAMYQNGIVKLLFASSATVYGENSSAVLSETYGPLLPISLYGSGKLACEGIISAYCHLFGIKACIFRFANVVGALMGHGVIHDFIQKLRKNSAELEILGDGKQEKPFFLIEDCIEGMIHIFNNADRECDVYNLGCSSYTNITRVAEIVVDAMQLKNVKFKYTGGIRGWPGDVPVVRYNVEKARRYGWAAMHSSDDAVRIAAGRLIEEIK